MAGRTVERDFSVPTILDSEAALKSGPATALVRLDPVIGASSSPAAPAPPCASGRRVSRDSPGSSSANSSRPRAPPRSARALTARLGAVTPQPCSRRPDEDAARGRPLGGRRSGRCAPSRPPSPRAALPLDALHELPADEAHARLTALKGIGPWTADVYLLFCLGHPDAFPAGDLALQEAARLAFGLDARPDAKALAALAEAWRPLAGGRGEGALVLLPAAQGARRARRSDRRRKGLTVRRSGAV